MANIIQHKRNSTPGAAPAATGIAQGELAINIGDGKLYTKNSADNIINLGVTSISGTYITPASGNFSNSLQVNGVEVSVSGHSHQLVPYADSLITNVFNKTGSTIPKFSVVYIDGGQGDQPTINLAIGNGEAGSSKTYGITSEAISHMGTGIVIVAGSLTGVNTDQFNPTAPTGDVNGTGLWLSPSVSGGLTTTKPSAPNHAVYVATVVRTHQNEGVVEVRIQNGFELQELHNVALNGTTNGQFLQYNSSSGLWMASSSGNFTHLTINSNQIITGTGIANHIAYWNSTSGIVADSGQLYWDSTNDRLGIGTASPTTNLNIEGDASTNSLVKIGTLEFQPYALNNAWFGENVYFDGTDFVRRQTGSAGLFYFQGSEGQFRFSASDNAGTSVSSYPVWKILSDGSMGVGTGLDYTTGSLVGASFTVTSNGGVAAGGEEIGGYIGTGAHRNQFIAPDGAGTTPLVVIGGDGCIQLWSDSVATTACLFGLGVPGFPSSDYNISIFNGSWNTRMTIVSSNGYVGIGTVTPDSTLHVVGDANIDGNLTFDSFTESVVANGNSGTSKTLSLASGTVHTCTLTGNCTFTMPTATAGKSFSVFLNTGSGNYTASFSGVRWADSATPTATITASKVDIYSFISDGTYWYGSFSQNYG